MNEPIDLLQIKIERAKAQLPEDTQNAINAVDWKAVILGIRETKGYSFEQLGDLEIETELVLCGLLNPENYSKELESRMRLSRAEVDDLVKEMNERVFAKIKENLIKNIERKKVFTKQILANDTEEEKKKDTQILNSAGIEIVSPRLIEEGAGSGDSKENHLTFGTPPQKGGKGQTTPPILAQKLSGYVKNDVVETKHSLENITKTAPTSYPPKGDPYRLPPD